VIKKSLRKELDRRIRSLLLPTPNATWVVETEGEFVDGKYKPKGVKWCYRVRLPNDPEFYCGTPIFAIGVRNVTGELRYSLYLGDTGGFCFFDTFDELLVFLKMILGDLRLNPDSEVGE
jgi:hypothetical protein